MGKIIKNGIVYSGGADSASQIPYNHTNSGLAATNVQAAVDEVVDDISNKMDKTNPIGTGSFSLNRKANTTIGTYSVAEGDHTTASGYAAHAEGTSATASGDYSHAEGGNTVASGDYSHAEGSGTVASGTQAHAEGTSTTASNNQAHAEGNGTTASEAYAHAEGGGTTASNTAAHAEGGGTTASGSCAHAEGGSTTASGVCAHAEGGSTTASGACAHAEGSLTIAAGVNQHVGGKLNIADNDDTYAEIIGNGTADDARSNARTLDWSGNETIAGDLIFNGNTSLSTGLSNKMDKTNPTGTGSFSLNRKANTTIGTWSVAEGYNGTASAAYSHAEGYSTTASGSCAHAEGRNTTASSIGAHAEGYYTNASGQYSHAEGDGTTASGTSAHAEGVSTTASSYYSHAEGQSTTASAEAAHAEGYYTTASGGHSHAEGDSTIAASSNQHVSGKFNIADDSNTYAEIIGNGIYKARSNARTLDWNGNEVLSGTIEASGFGTTLLNLIYPVGSIYISVNNVNPGTYLTGTTWEAFASGKTLVGVDANDTDFDTVEETGGAKSNPYTPQGNNAAVTLTAAQSGVPAHSHGLNNHRHFTVANTYGVKGNDSDVGTQYSIASYASSPNSDLPYSLRGGYNKQDATVGRTSAATGNTASNTATNASQSHNHTFTGTASNISTLQPYITCYMWKRTA